MLKTTATYGKVTTWIAFSLVVGSGELQELFLSGE